MVTYNKHDLEFILKQIEISEAHAAGADLTDLVPNPLLPYGLRTVDGTYNNIIPGRETWGSADQPFPQLLPPEFRVGDPYPFDPDGPGPLQAGDISSYEQTSGLVFDSQPRIISNLIVDQTANNPAAVAAAAAREGSFLLSTLAQNGNFEAAFQSAPTVTALGDFTVGGIANWTTTGSAGLFDPTAAVLPQLPGVDTGNKVAFANPGGSLSTTIGEFGAGDVYDVNFSIYGRTDTGAANYSVEVLVGGVSLGVQTGVGPAGGAAADVSFSFDTTGFTLTDGASVELVIRATGGGQLDIDNVSTGDGGLFFIPNQAPDEGISAPFNSWMTLFGQFFDHGLDLVTKGGGTVFVPLQPDDPLYVEGSQTNFMVLTRATNQPGEDGILGTADDVRLHTNTTTPLVDQNQTYTSHASHQVFLREYTLNDEGRPVSTGHLLEGSAGGLATWADIKTQAREMLGIELSDYDVANVPYVRTDAYGKFIPDPVTGFAQLILDAGVDGILNNDDDTVVVGTPANPVSTLDVFGDGSNIQPARIGHAFLDDIAHAAVPFNSQTGVALAPDAGDDVGGSLDTPPAGTYDNDLLDRHFITGDGRGNENIGLSTVHHVFHSEHNRLAEHTKDTVIEDGADDLAFVNAWLLTPVDQAQLDAINALTGDAKAAAIDALDWNGEYLFQAARFGTEMQYQHLVFEEFARKVNPAVDLFVFNPTMDVDPAIFAEFAHVVYRFGHSMLTETVDRLDADGIGTNDMGLIEAFLNPVAFGADYANADEAAGAIVRGMTRQTGNEIDEFVTEALRNNLLGLPLDLATINITRARDAGVPSLQAARAEFFEMTKSEWLKPYSNWVDFAQHIKNPASVVNFIAAYGTHELITAEDTVAGKRAAATAIVLNQSVDWTDADGIVHTIVPPADRVAFLNATGTWAPDGAGANDDTLGGLNNVDLWIGGLAESILPFGGMLGSTFTFVFEAQMENLQNGDRFYYLSRTQGLHFLTELENNAFSKLIMLNTDLGDADATHLPGEIFARVDHILEVNQAIQAEADPEHDDPILNALEPKVLRVDADVDGTPIIVDGASYDNLLKFIGGEHVVLGGSEEDDVLIADLGDDTIWGDGGNDLIIGGHGINRLHGGTGNDIIYGGGDPEFIHGDEGDDAIQGGNGLGDLIFAGEGNDFVLGGIDGKEVFGGEGNDFILGSPDVDFLLGGEGDDWIEGGEGFDTLAGDNSELFFNSTVIGHDVLISGTNENDFDAESGDDIMVQGESVMRSEGMSGFDWSIFKDMPLDAYADMRIPIFTTVEADILRNRFDHVEALSGWKHNDTLIGDDRTLGDPNATLPSNLPPPEGTLDGDELTMAGVNRIAGLQAIVQPYIDAVVGPITDDTVIYEHGNILLGGDGNDTITGNAGDDIIDGDAWLNVRIGIVDGNGAEIGTSDSIQGLVHFYSAAEVDALGEGYAVANANLLAQEQSPLDDLIFTRALTGSQLQIVREVLTDQTALYTGTLPPPAEFNVDVAVFNGALSEYAITTLDGTVVDLTGDFARPLTEPLRVTHTGAAANGGAINDGSDIVRNIEILQFADQSINIGPADNEAAGGLMTLSIVGGGVAAIGQTFEVTLGDPLSGGVVDGNGLPGPDGAPDFPGGFSIVWQFEETPGVWANIEDPVTEAQITGATFTPTALMELEGLRIRAVASFVDDDGFPEIVFSTESGPLASQIAPQGTDGGDFLVGTEGPDVIDALAGDDEVLGLGGADLLIGGPGDDILDGGAGADTLNGNGGDDLLIGGAGQDILNGGAGSDELQGGAGADTLDGGNGSDILDGGAGNDTAVFNGARADFTFEITPTGTLEVLQGADEDEVINIETLLFTDGPVTLDQIFDQELGAGRLDAIGPDFSGVGNTADFVIGHGGANEIDGNGGADILFGMGGADIINGGNGADILLGGNGTDTIHGDAGADFLNGEGGSDALFGDGGADTIWGGEGDDELNGGAGADTLDGGLGNDMLTGGGGVDTFVFTGAFGNDEITDFTGQDIIDLTAFEMAFTDLTVEADEITGDAVISSNFAGFGTITLTGVAPGTVTADDFDF